MYYFAFLGLIKFHVFLADKTHLDASIRASRWGCSCRGTDQTVNQSDVSGHL